MEPKLSEEQRALEDVVTGIFTRYSETDASSTGRANQALLGALDDGGYLELVTEAGAMNALLVVEFAARAVANAPVAARALVAPLLGVTDLPLNVALAERCDGGLVRYGNDLEAVLALDGDRAVYATRDDCEIEPVESRYGYPFARVTIRRSTSLGDGSASRLRTAWRLGLAAEIGGTALGAIRHTASYVTERHQFNRPIGSFQAVQHRLATSYVMAEGTRWIARRASASPEDAYLAAAAAAYGCLTAKDTYTSTQQVSGGIGSTTEYGLVAWTMRLIALQRELGGHRAHAADIVAARVHSVNAVRLSDL